jgi:sodium-dependent dicarboxylate transporter 2/3/5
MMLPIALAVIQGTTTTADHSTPSWNRLFRQCWRNCHSHWNATQFGDDGAYRDLGFEELSFAQWMSFGMPVTIVMVVVIWLWVGRNLSKNGSQVALSPSGKWTQAETRTLTIFALTALAWITRSEPFGGWKTWLDLPQANDASVAFIAVLLLFCLPNGEKREKNFTRLENCQPDPMGHAHSGRCRSLPGGSIQTVRSQRLHCSSPLRLENLPTIGLILGICLLVTFLTEITSNTATTSLLMPILGATAIAAKLDPKLLLIPAALSASCAFMLPVATIPNAVVFGTGKISFPDGRRRICVNLIGAGVVTGVIYFLL